MKQCTRKTHVLDTSGKYMRILRLCLFLMVMGTGIASANLSYSQSTVLTLNANGKTLQEVFREIENQSEYIIFYNDDAINVNKRVDISVENATITQILDKVLDTNAKYKIEDRQVILYKEKSNETPAPTPEVKQAPQNRVTINGKVRDDQGEILLGATVLEKGTTNGVVTDLDGNYSISVNPGATLVFSYIGQETVERKVGNDNVMNVILPSATSNLDEVVIVGYGMQRKSSITGSISSVNVEDMKAITTPRVENMLQGKVAGVSVTPTSGKPGEVATIRIRGIGSIRGNKDPLWVIDGVIGDMSGNAIANLNPNDIETISVLKDGSATAMYGSRGANGVIQVTTKRGIMGVSQIEASARMGVSQLQKGKLRMMNGEEYYDYVAAAFENAGKWENWLQPYLKDRNTDWWDIGTQNALSQNYNIGYRYGNDKIRSYISGDYYNEEGTIKGATYDRFTLRVNTDYVVNKRLTLKAKIATSYRESFNQEHSLSYTSYTPWDTPYDSQGNLKIGGERPSADVAADADPSDYWYSDGGTNYLYDRHLNWSKSRTNATDLGGGFNFKIFDYLSLESNNKVGFTNYFSESYTDPDSRSGEAKNGTIENTNSTNRLLYSNQTLQFLKTFAEKHEVNAYLGYEYDERRYWTNKGQSSNMFPGNEVLSGGADSHNVTGGKTEEKQAAVIFNANYGFDSKYLFQVLLRRDGSSRYGANKRWATFWSLGAGWNMHEEEFVKQLGFVNEFKPRISYGISGNMPSGAYEWTTKFDTTSEYGNEVAFRTDYAGNPNLSWEETGSLNFGVDMRLFDRVNITFEYYAKKVKNLVYLRHLPAVTGFNRQTANDGKLENRGIEFTINPEIIKTKDIYWDINFNLGYNKNEITYLPDGDDLVFQAVAVGYPINNFYTREWAGVDAMTGAPLWFITDKETGEKSVTGNYNDATLVLLNASPTPKINGGFNTTFSWKDLSLNANFIFSAGAKIYNQQRAGALDRDGERVSQPPMRLAKGWTRWEKPGDIATHPQIKEGGNNNSSAQSTRYLENGDFFKLKTLTLSYSLPKKWLAPAGVKDSRISIGGENLFTITKFSGYDPEILLSSRFTGTTTSSDGSQVYPTTRRFTIELNFKF